MWVLRFLENGEYDSEKLYLIPEFPYNKIECIVC